MYDGHRILLLKSSLSFIATDLVHPLDLFLIISFQICFFMQFILNCCFAEHVENIIHEKMCWSGPRSKIVGS